MESWFMTSNTCGRTYEYINEITFNIFTSKEGWYCLNKIISLHFGTFTSSYWALGNKTRIFSLEDFCFHIQNSTHKHHLFSVLLSPRRLHNMINKKMCVVNLYKQQFVKKMGQKSSIPLTGDALMSQSITFPSSEAVKNTLLSSGWILRP